MQKIKKHIFTKIVKSSKIDKNKTHMPNKVLNGAMNNPWQKFHMQNYRQVKSVTRSSVCSLTWPLGWSKESNNRTNSSSPRVNPSPSPSNSNSNHNSTNNNHNVNNLSHSNVSNHSKSNNINNTNKHNNVHSISSNVNNNSNSLKLNNIQVAMSANLIKAIETRTSILFLSITDTEADTRSHLCIITINVPPTLAYLGCKHSFQP